MNTQSQFSSLIQSFRKIRFGIFRAGLMVAVALGALAVQSALATNIYFDANGTTSGFGSPSGTNWDLIGTTNQAAAGGTTLSTGFGSGAPVTSVVVASATGITTGMTMFGTGVPNAGSSSGGPKVTSVAGTTIGLSSFTSTAASSGTYYFGFPYSWDTATAGTGPITPVSSFSDVLCFGNAGSDLAGYTFSVVIDYSSSWTANINVISTSANITLIGGANAHLGGNPTWTVAGGSTLDEDVTYQGKGWNFNGHGATINGAGTFTFGSLVGYGASTGQIITENMSSGGVVNFDWTITGANTFVGGYTLQAGTLNFESSACTNAFEDSAAANPFTIDAGTIIDNTSGLPLTLSIGAGGTTIAGSFTNTGSSSLSLGNAAVTLTTSPTINVKANTLTIGGIISGSGDGLTKVGNGTLALTNVNAYTGDTTVSNGTLTLATLGSLLTSPQIAVASGATFDVSGLAAPFLFILTNGQTLGGNGVVTGNVVAATSSIIDAGLYGGSTLNFSNNLTLNGDTVNGVTNHFVLSPMTGGANSLIIVSNQLVLNGTNTISINYSTLGTGTYPLIKYASESLGAGATLNLAGFAGGSRQTAVIQDTGGSPGQIQLVVNGSSANLTWVGDGSANNWDASTLNWSNQATTLTDHFYYGDAPTFNDFGSETTAHPVQLVGALASGPVLVTNTGSYLFISSGGGGNLGGSASLTKLGSGSLTLMEAGDSFSGGITMGGGSLVLSNTTASISGGITVTNGSVLVSDDGSISGGLAMNNTASGSPSAVLAGSGTLNGGVAMSAGSLAVGGTVTINSGMAVNGSVIVTNSPALSGGLTVNGGTTILDQSTTPSGSLTINGGTAQLGNNDTLGNLPSGSFTSSGTLAFDRSDNPLLWTSVIASGSVAQIGSGVLQLYGANTYTGTTLIQNGTLMVTNNASLGTLPGGAVTINSGGTLDLGGFSPTLLGLGNKSANFGAKQFNIAGAGVGGLGAIINSGWTNQTSAFELITLTGDATIGGNSAAANPQTGRYDVRGGIATLDLAGHKLTKISSNLVAVVGASGVGGIITNTGGGTASIEIQGGVLSFQNTSPNSAIAPGVTITVDSGAALGFYAANVAYVIWPITLNAGASIENDGKNSSIGSPITLAGNATLVADTYTNTLNGAISSTGAYGLTVTTNLWTVGTYLNGVGGIFTLGGTNTYTGNTVINNGVLALGATGSISNSAGISIAAGTTFDVSAIPAFSLSASTALSASGTGTTVNISTTVGANAAAINGASGGTVNLGLQPITLNYDGTHPALYVSQGTLVLNGNAFTVNTASPLAPGSYVIVQQAGGNITSAGSYAVTGTAIGSSRSGSISVVNGTVVLTIVEHQPVAGNATYSRAQGTALKISITNLLAQYASDPAGDPLGLSGVAGGLVTNNSVIATTANGSSVDIANPYDGSAYIILTPVNNLGESFSYTVTNSNYGTLSATGTITITVTNAAGQASGNILSVGPSSVTTSWAGIPGSGYNVLRSTNLTVGVGAGWVNIWTTNAPVGGTFQFIDTFPDIIPALLPTPPPSAYYKLQQN